MKAVFFDMGGVVWKPDAGHIHGLLCGYSGLDRVKFDEIYAKYKDGLSTGRMSTSSFISMVEERFGVVGIEDAWMRAYRESAAVNEDVLKIADSMRSRYTVGMITNSIDIQCRLNRERGLYDRFNPSIISCEVGVKKPGKEIFLIALEKVGLDASECVQIDDKEENITQGRNLGFKSILFSNAPQLRRDLEALGMVL